MDFSEYFLQELKALRESGKAFALEHPRLAAFLGEEGQDPDVERILEAVAFLTARLQQRVDQGFSEVTHDLLRLLWPAQLQITPPLTMVAFSPTASASGPVSIPKGTEVLSDAVDGQPCRFQTSRALEVWPWEVAGCRWLRENEQDALQLDMRLLTPDPLAQDPPDEISFYLQGDARQTGFWFQMLHRNIDCLTLQVDDLPAICGSVEAEAEAFDPDFALLPADAKLADGMRIASEYLLYPEKFPFVRLKGLSAIWRRCPDVTLESARRLRWTLRLKERVPEAHREVSRLICLHVSPAVNLFECDAVPLDIDHLHSRYLMQPEGQPDGVQAHSISRIEGWNRDQRRYRTYQPLADALGQISERHDKVWFWERCLPSQVSRYHWHLWLGFYGEGRQAVLPAREVIHARLLCTDGLRARKLGVGDIRQPSDVLAPLVTFRNISPVTPPLYPWLHSHRLFELLGLLQRSGRTVDHLSELAEMLRTLDRRSHYDRSHSEAARRKISSLLGFASRDDVSVRRGIPRMGRAVTLEVDESGFLGEGDLYLFGCVLYSLLSGQRRLNESFSLTLKGHKHQGVWRW
ncbi:MAG: type VI secretion system baseplate subunit TssF [Gammaproteobacteria bacterium]|nr:MAG: type VI secretion system baseplate subunit TssF [Gammaproteobacteria bacterium]